MDYKNEFIEFMAQAEVLTFGDFTTKSGRKTPYFVNTGKYNNGQQISKLGKFYANCILDNIKDTKNLVLFGPAYKGIPLVVATSIALNELGYNVKYCFNRKEEKDHGEGGSLVGHKLSNGDRVLIIEDVITAGTAVREVLPIIKGAGAKVEGLVISVNRMEKGISQRTAIQEIWEEFEIPTFPIVNALDILNHLHNRDIHGKIYINDKLATNMKAYMAEYCVF